MAPRNKTWHYALFLWVGLFTTSTQWSGWADSWMPPTPFEKTSENGKFVAKVIPGSGKTKPKLVVSAINAGTTNRVWITHLGNSVAPIDVFLTDDGQSVLTFDNWGSVGYGDNVVAIYNKSGESSRYSLDQFAPLPPEQNGAGSHGIDPFAYRTKFQHSTSSRHWSRNSLGFFMRESEDYLFCLWLDWDDRWVAWRMRDGEMISLSADAESIAKREGLRRARDMIRLEDSSDSNISSKTMGTADGAMSFLGRMGFQEDRILAEKWLKDSHFSSGTQMSDASETAPIVSFFSYSDRRERADRVLGRWGNSSSTDRNQTYEDYTYRFLGALECMVGFYPAPQEGEGVLKLYLIPESIPLEKWQSAQPSQYLTANLGDQPLKYQIVRSGSKRAGKTLQFKILGICPGNYRLKTIWDKAASFSKPDGVVCRPGTGDYESVTSPIVEIKRGLTTKDVHLDCKTLVK